MNRRRFLELAAGSGAIVAGCSGGGSDSPTETKRATRSDTPRDHPDTIFVSPDGSHGNPGTETEPLRTIQQAMRKAMPGWTVYVKSGHYYESVYSARDGRPDEPITITGPPEAILHGDPDQRWTAGLRVDHSHIHLRGLTLDGLLDPDNPDSPDSYANCNYTTEYGRDHYLEDLVVKPHAVGNVLQAAVKFGKANHVEVGEFVVHGPAGIQHLKGDKEGHNGEIIYIGTPYGNLDAHYVQFDNEIDTSHNYHVHHVANTAGHPHAELVDVKEGTYDVTIEYCTDAGGGGQYLLPDHDPTSEAAIGVRGREITLRWSIIENARGHGVEVGVWDLAHPDGQDPPVSSLPEKAKKAGRDNSIYHNRIEDNGGLAIKYPQYDNGEIAAMYGPDDQKVVCGNEINGETQGQPSKGCSQDIPVGNGIGHLGGDSPWA